MRKITDITIEEVIELLKLVDKYDAKRTYKLRVLPIGESTELVNLKKWVRVYRDIKTRACFCPEEDGCSYNDIADRIVLNLRDDEVTVYFVSDKEISYKSFLKMKQFLKDKGFDIKK